MSGLCNPSVEYVPCLAIEFFSVLSFGQLSFLLSMTHLSWETTCGICEWKMNTSLPLLCTYNRPYVFPSRCPCPRVLAPVLEALWVRSLGCQTLPGRLWRRVRPGQHCGCPTMLWMPARAVTHSSG